MKRKQVISGTILFVLALVSICTAKVITVIPGKDNTLYQDNQGSLRKCMKSSISLVSTYES